MISAVLAALAVAVVAQQPPAIPPESKQFDFWVGEWTATGEMTGANGAKTPTNNAVNVITRSFDGHVVQENFRMGNFKGMSVSIFDPQAKLWRQTWVDNSGSYIALTGEFKDGKMTLTTIPKPKAPNNAGRMIFYNIKPGSFDWDWEGTTDGGKTWKLNWRLHYVRKKG